MKQMVYWAVCGAWKCGRFVQRGSEEWSHWIDYQTGVNDPTRYVRCPHHWTLVQARNAYPNHTLQYARDKMIVASKYAVEHLNYGAHLVPFPAYDKPLKVILDEALVDPLIDDKMINEIVSRRTKGVR